ncbi:MAG: LCP family protein [Oscillospiraceae bacterium]|nr:LCP family protein [Oscillospiraceae bacterium]
MEDNKKTRADDDPFDDADEDLLSQIRRWTAKAQHEKANRANAAGYPPGAQNPWAPELAAAADRALEDDPQGGLPKPLAKQAKRPAREKKSAAGAGAKASGGGNATKRGERMRKKRRPFRSALALVLAFVFLLCAGGYALAFSAAGKLDRQAIQEIDRKALDAAAGSSRVTNILLLGVDEEEGGRTDTMLLLSIDRAHRKLKLTSFLRDSWLPLPNSKTGQLDKSGKLNTAIHQGGPAAVMRAIAGNFDVRIDHYVMVDFKVFQGLVDALGGVSVAITRKEAEHLYKTAGPFKKMGGKDGLEEMRRQMRDWETNEKDGELLGAVKLDGLQALVYCRIRKLDDDFMRTTRQRKFMNSLISACKRNPLRLLGLLGGDTLSSVKTDMSQLQLANLAAMAPLLLGYGVEEFRVPADHTWSYATKQGMSVIELKKEANAALLWAFIYEE